MLLALEETDNALVAYRQQQERLVKLTDAARESARAATIARARYREGVADFLSLLDAERTELQAEDGAAQAEADRVHRVRVALPRARRDPIGRRKGSISSDACDSTTTAQTAAKKHNMPNGMATDVASDLSVVVTEPP